MIIAEPVSLSALMAKPLAKQFSLEFSVVANNILQQRFFFIFPFANRYTGFEKFLLFVIIDRVQKEITSKKVEIILL